MTPFRFDEGKRALEELWFFCDMDNLDRSAVLCNAWKHLNLRFDEVLAPDPTLEGTDAYDPLTDGVDLEACYDIWVCAAMVAAAFCDGDDSLDFADCADLCEKVRAALQKKLTKKRFFTKKPIYDLAALRRNAAEALTYITGERCASEAAESMGEHRSAFVGSVHDLAERLLRGLPEEGSEEA